MTFDTRILPQNRGSKSETWFVCGTGFGVRSKEYLVLVAKPIRTAQSIWSAFLLGSSIYLFVWHYIRLISPAHRNSVCLGSEWCTTISVLGEGNFGVIFDAPDSKQRTKNVIGNVKYVNEFFFFVMGSDDGLHYKSFGIWRLFCVLAFLMIWKIHFIEKYQI